MKLKDIIKEGDVIHGKFGKHDKPNDSIDIPQGYESFYAKRISDKVSAIIGVKKDGKEVQISTGDSKGIELLAKEYNAGGKAGTGIKKISMMQAFGSHELNIAHDIGIKLIEKPHDWDEIEDKQYSEKDWVKLNAEMKKFGYKLKEYSFDEIYNVKVDDGIAQMPRSPHVSVKKMPEEHMFFITTPGLTFLCDRTGAESYIRFWCAFDY